MFFANLSSMITYSYKRGDFMKRKNKVCLGLLAGGLLAITCGFAGCGNTSGAVTLRASEVYAVGASTAGVLMTEQFVATAGASVMTAAEDAQTLQNVKNSLDRYMTVFDNLVGGQSAITVTKTENQTAENGTTYAIKLTITSKLDDGATTTMYYNEQARDNAQNHVDADEYEHNTVFSGVMYVGEETEANRYSILNGERNVEAEQEVDETEFEEEISMRIFKDDNNYIDFSQSYEEENENGQTEHEQVYAFSIVKDGTSQGAFEYELERENNQIEAECEQRVNGTTTRFEVEREGDRIWLKANNLGANNYNVYVTMEEGANGQFRYIYHIGDQIVAGDYRTL